MRLRLLIIAHNALPHYNAEGGSKQLDESLASIRVTVAVSDRVNTTIWSPGALHAAAHTGVWPDAMSEKKLHTISMQTEKPALSGKRETA